MNSPKFCGNYQTAKSRPVKPFNLTGSVNWTAIALYRRLLSALKASATRWSARSGSWQAQSAFLKHYPCFNKLLSQLYELTWYVHIGAALLDPAATVRYIGRYTKRAVLAEYRIRYYDGKQVRFAYRDYAQGGLCLNNGGRSQTAPTGWAAEL
jgi:hypothetical protein